MRSPILAIVLIAAVPVPLCADEPPKDAGAKAAKPIDFAHDILPLLKARCAKCHAAGKHEGDLSIDTRESLLKSKTVVPGDAKKSELIARVTSDDPEVRMPQEGEPLKPAEIALLRRWIDEGLAWQDGFTFAANRVARPLAVKRPKLPPPQAGRDHPIDRLVDAYFSPAQGRVPSAGRRRHLRASRLPRSDRPAADARAARRVR